MENNRFEDSFRNAFAGAEVSPTDAVWINIERELEKASGGNLKRNLLMFQLLAAASVAFAFGIGGLYYLNQPVTQDDFRKEMTDIQHVPAKKETGKSPVQKASATPSFQKKEEPVTGKVTVASNHPEEKIIQSLKKPFEDSPVARTISKTELLTFTQTKKPMLVLPLAEQQVEPDAGMVLLARLKDEEKKYQQEEKSVGANEKLWASVGFGAGSYKPNVQASSMNLSATSMRSAPSEAAVGTSYSVGVQVAGKISKRFIVQGGISYLTQSSNFTSTTVNQQHVAISEFMRPGNFDSYRGVDPYRITSNMQFVSIPVQAGYLVVDRAIGIQVNGGVSTDLFLSNTLSSDNDLYQKVTQTTGKESLYRTVNVSGLVGTEISYRIADHYRVSVNPGLRYALHSIYKDEVAADITPVTVDVSLRFRYIFK